MTWHLDPEQSRRYLDGSLVGARAASVEAHVMACAQCRAALAVGVPAARMDAVWAAIVDVVDTPRVTWVERVMCRFGVQPEEARLLATAPSLKLSWLLSVCVALAFVGFAPVAVDRTTLGFLVLAPLVPVLGVACAYGRGVDPTYELTRSTPYPSARLLLLRVVAVLVASLAVTVPFAVIFARGWQPMSWLLPALALVGLTLVAARWLQLPVAATLVAGCYLLVIVSAVKGSAGVASIFNGSHQWVWLAAAVACLGFVISSSAYRGGLRRPS